MHPHRIKSVCLKNRGLFLLIVLFYLSFCIDLSCQQLPVGYISYYSYKANKPDFFKTLVISPGATFILNKEKTYTILDPMQLDSAGIILPPASKGIIADKIFGEFIIEFEYKIQLGSLLNTSGFYFLCPVKSDSTYYATIFSADSITFLVVNNGTILKQEGNAATTNSGWNKVRIQRNILNRQLIITMNNDSKNTISYSDPNLVMGFVGFGTHEIESYIRNINIWAPTAFCDTLYHSE